MFCSACGTRLESSAQFCSSCGQPRYQVKVDSHTQQESMNEMLEKPAKKVVDIDSNEHSRSPQPYGPPSVYSDPVRVSPVVQAEMTTQIKIAIGVEIFYLGYLLLQANTVPPWSYLLIFLIFPHLWIIQGLMNLKNSARFAALIYGVASIQFHFGGFEALVFHLVYAGILIFTIGVHRPTARIFEELSYKDLQSDQKLTRL